MYRVPQESVVRTSELQPDENDGPKAPLKGIHVETTEWNLWNGEAGRLYCTGGPKKRKAADSKIRRLEKQRIISTIHNRAVHNFFLQGGQSRILERGVPKVGEAHLPRSGPPRKRPSLP